MQSHIEKDRVPLEEVSQINKTHQETQTVRKQIQDQAPRKGKKSRLFAKTYATDNLTSIDVQRMYSLFSQYYEEHNYAQFLKDLMEKNHVIILRDQDSKVIQGFSTLLTLQLVGKDGRRVTGIYSGDTLVAQEYWGSPALGIEFLKYLWKQKLKNPFEAHFWFLISKGYKTYLLMANNFKTHYPRYETKTPQVYQELMDQFYQSRFQKTYNPTLGLIQPQGPSCSLKESVAEITEPLLKIPRIRFFQQQNPHWRQGEELCCIAEMTLIMPIQYALKKFWKGLFNGSAKHS